MAIPHKCPVCKGRTVVNEPERREYPNGTGWIVHFPQDVPCPACKGTGIVWEKEYTSFVNAEDA